MTKSELIQRLKESYRDLDKSKAVYYHFDLYSTITINLPLLVFEIIFL